MIYVIFLHYELNVVKKYIYLYWCCFRQTINGSQNIVNNKKHTHMLYVTSATSGPLFNRTDGKKEFRQVSEAGINDLRAS